MKLAIYTQIYENYGEVGNPFWKPKGGDVYVVADITEAQQVRIVADGIPNLQKLITRDDAVFREYVIGYEIVEDDVKVHQEWESPIMLTWCREDGRKYWKAARTTINDGQYINIITKKLEGFELGPNGEQVKYTVRFVLTDGSVLSAKSLQERLTETQESP